MWRRLHFGNEEKTALSSKPDRPAGGLPRIGPAFFQCILREWKCSAVLPSEGDDAVGDVHRACQRTAEKAAGDWPHSITWRNHEAPTNYAPASWSAASPLPLSLTHDGLSESVPVAHALGLGFSSHRLLQNGRLPLDACGADTQTAEQQHTIVA